MTKNNNILPQGWQTKSLGQIGTFLKGKGIAKAEIVETGKPCIRYGQIYSEYNYFVEEFKSFIDETSAKNSEPIFKNDLLFAASGETLTDIGKCVAYIKEGEAYAGGDIVILRPNSEDAHFLGYLFNADDFKKQTYKLGQGHSVVHIYSSSLKNVKVTLPPLPEQQKISKILATWDKAIKLQQHLIDNKKQYKKAVMKKLLTGEMRFKGFSEEWKTIRLGDLGEIKTSSVDKIFVAGEAIVDLVNYMDVYRNKSISADFQCSKTSVNERELQTFNLVKGDILFTPSSETPDDIGHSCVITEDLNNTVYSYHLVRYRFFNNKSMSYGFRAYVFNNQKILIEFAKRATGSTRFTISKKDFEDVKARIPNSIDEQNKIASTLKFLECEISFLENELLYFQKQKQGLMQQLLTGKLRVKN